MPQDIDKSETHANDVPMVWDDDIKRCSQILGLDRHRLMKDAASVAARSRVATDGVDLEIASAPHGSSTHPYLVRQLSTKDARQSTEGYPMMVDLS